jgi:hypothetical protein
MRKRDDHQTARNNNGHARDRPVYSCAKDVCKSFKVWQGPKKQNAHRMAGVSKV